MFIRLFAVFGAIFIFQFMKDTSTVVHLAPYIWTMVKDLEFKRLSCAVRYDNKQIHWVFSTLTFKTHFSRTTNCMLPVLVLKNHQLCLFMRQIIKKKKNHLPKSVITKYHFTKYYRDKKFCNQLVVLRPKRPSPEFKWMQMMLRYWNYFRPAFS